MKKVEKMIDRTVRDFVRDLVKRGRTNSHIKHVALCTRWKGDMEEVEQWLGRRGDRWRKKFKNS